jgi:hypothetical protein
MPAVPGDEGTLHAVPVLGWRFPAFRPVVYGWLMSLSGRYGVRFNGLTAIGFSFCPRLCESQIGRPQTWPWVE